MARVPPIVRRAARTSMCGCAGWGLMPDANAVETGPVTCQRAGILKPLRHRPQEQPRSGRQRHPQRALKTRGHWQRQRETRRWGQNRSILKNSVAGRNETVETSETKFYKLRRLRGLACWGRGK